MATVTFARPGSARLLDLLAGLGQAAWRLLTSVRFAVLQIIAIVVAGVFGALLQQMPASALQDPSQYADQLAQLHARYDAVSVLGVTVGPAMVDVFEQAGLFHVFSVWWFTLLLTTLVVSIIVCTLDRTPKLWRGVHDVHVFQPPAFFDERLPGRGALDVGLDDAQVAAVLRRHHYVVRRAEGIVYGDRNQYFRLATLLTHAGLVLFLAAAAITGAFGFETVLLLGDGQTAPVQAVGTPGNLIVKNVAFSAPRRPDGTYVDYSSNLAVYRDGREIASKTIHVNDPLTVDGYVFHQNTFGPAADLEIRDASGRLVWTGPVLLDGTLVGLPQGFTTIPGSDLGLLLVLDTGPTGAGQLTLEGLAADAAGQTQVVFMQKVGVGQTSDAATTAGYTIRWTDTSAFSGIVVKRDPGQMLVWIAYLLLISGLVLTFYFPRRRVWARLSPERTELAMLTDRYVDGPRELRSLVRDLAAAQPG